MSLAVGHSKDHRPGYLPPASPLTSRFSKPKTQPQTPTSITARPRRSSGTAMGASHETRSLSRALGQCLSASRGRPGSVGWWAGGLVVQVLPDPRAWLAGAGATSGLAAVR